MKVLVVHNRYQQRGGEDTVVDAEMAMLSARGHDVSLFERHNDDIATLPRTSLAIQTFWSKPAGRDFRAALQSFRPDVIHVHNTFPLISPSIYWEADRAGVPVVQTLHNYRLLCSQALLLRQGKVCEDCVGRLPWRGVIRGCYRGSVAQSAVAAGTVVMHRLAGTWQRKVTRYIALTDFSRHKFIAGGLPAERIVVKPNFVHAAPPTECERSDFLFVGRLTVEKGIQLLAAVGPQLKGTQIAVAGTGPDAAQLTDVAGVVPLGELPREAVYAGLQRTVALVMPSICYEPFGMTILEAFANGTPVIASRIAGLPDLVRHGETGLLFEPGNTNDLMAQLTWAQAHPDEMAAMGLRARNVYENHYSAEQNYHQLIAIYEDAIREKRLSDH